MIKRARSPHSGTTRCVEAEEVDARFAVIGDIGAHIQFRQRGKSGYRREISGANAAHAERNDTDPALGTEGIERKLRRNQRPDLIRRDRPVGEEQIMPGLLHDPGAGGQRPRTVRGLAEQRVHANSVDGRCECGDTALAASAGHSSHTLHIHVAYPQACRVPFPHS